MIASTAVACKPVCLGHPRFRDAALAKVAADLGIEQAWREAFSRYGVSAPQRVSGDFAVALSDQQGRVYLAVDRFAIRSLCYRVEGNGITYAERADTLTGSTARLDPQSLFAYLYFHVIPAPATIFEGVQRLPAGHCGVFDKGRLEISRWWVPAFIETTGGDLDALGNAFRGLLRDSVARQLDEVEPGCYLSGGTDSSTVAGFLGEVTGKPARTFSIGFEASGYDEMEYARITARHFGTEHHEYYITPEDLVTSIPEVAAHYDQPFGNSSTLPAYYCARAARSAGVSKLLAGDGGDELFGGNTRYAKQTVFAWYGAVPEVLRRRLLEPVFCGHSALGRTPGLRKLASYVDQARVPMPERLQTYNLLQHHGIENILSAEFCAQIDPQVPARDQRAYWTQVRATSLINRMLAFDWKYALADNDLPKVRDTADLAGIAVGFPLLDDELVDFSLRLPPRYKLRGLKLRWFFREALRGFLPGATLAKKKHGFGLPFGVWTAGHSGLRSLAADALRSLATRDIVRGAFIDELLTQRFPQQPGYYGEMVWVLMMLEHWLRAHCPDAVLTGGR